MRNYTFRLKAGQELFDSISLFIWENEVWAGCKKHRWHLDSGCKIYTTAEIVLPDFDEVIYKREYAEDSGYEELVLYDASGTA
jgi:hypothetical protein